MKIKSKLILTSFFALIFVLAYSQRIIEDEVTFTDTQFPLEPLGQELKGYYFEVSTPYAENNDKIIEFSQQKHQEELDNYPQKIEEYKVKYEQELIQYEKDIEIARENFKIESEEFNKMSKLERFALSDQKPTLKLPPRPKYRIPSEPRYVKPNLSNSITYDPSVLSNAYLRLAGYDAADKNDPNVLSGTIVLHEFEYLDPQQKVEEKSYINPKTKNTQVKRTIHYITSYKRPVFLTLNYNGSELYNGVFEQSSKFVELNTKQIPNKLNLEKKSVEEQLLIVNSFVNNLYGFSEINTTINIRFVKNKNGEYDDVEESKELALEGYKNFKNGDRNSELFDAVESWEEILKESNLEERKARINKNVSIALMFNILETSYFLNDFVKVDEMIQKLEKIKLNFREKKDLSFFKSKKEDRKNRFSVNNR